MVKAILQKDYIEVKIDQDRMKNGKAVAKKLRSSDGGGIPWMVILNAEGEPLVTSDGPKGNIGCPLGPEERSYFMEMIRKTAERIPEEDLLTLKSALDSFGEGILNRRKR